MERETKTFETPEKHIVVIYTYATGRESRDMEQIVMKALKVDITYDGARSVKDFDATSTQTVEEKMLKTMVVSFDGKTENLVDTILDLRKSEYDFIVNEVNEVLKKKN
jgi:hypothetical protein